MKKVIFTISILCSISTFADQTILNCDVPISDIYSIKIMKSPKGYYAELELSGSKKVDVPVSAAQVAAKSYDIKANDGSKIKLDYTAGSGWYVVSGGAGFSEQGLADCK